MHANEFQHLGKLRVPSVAGMELRARLALVLGIVVGRGLEAILPVCGRHQAIGNSRYALPNPEVPLERMLL
ncbi:hypothetical protein Y024_5276 [Burkholderia pseudomallei TSV44]|nr:hypothetical protein Y024_5276 [Burkholderia pseudomallei TSV44]